MLEPRARHREVVVTSSYAMAWQVGDGPRQAGKIEFDRAGMELTATTGSARVERVDFGEILDLVIDRRTLHVQRADAPELRIHSLDRPGTLRELAEWIAASRAAGNH